MRIVLISTYDLGHQPFGLASPAAWLGRAGFEVRCLDLAVEEFDEAAIRAAALVAFYLPMHTATRLAARFAPRVRAVNPGARLCCFGLYAPMNEAFLRRLGADDVLGGEFEASLVSIAVQVRDHARGAGTPQAEPAISLDRLTFIRPERGDLPPLSRYSHLHDREGRIRVVGYTEASRGCKHRCRHCPIVPIYDGRFRVVDRDVVLADIRQQVAAGAQHITFGDPDFFNGIGHAVPLLTRLAEEFPGLGYDVTIKVEHLLRHREHLPLLRDTGCLLVTSAVESFDDHVLRMLDKGHTRDDFFEASRLCREAGLTLQPTFVAFTPWTTLASYREMLSTLEALDLVEHVAPVQLALRLLIPAGSRMLELPEVRELVGPFDEEALVHPWRHPDPEVETLQRELMAMVQRESGRRSSRRRIFGLARALAARALGEAEGPVAIESDAPALAAVPFLTEPWYC